MILWKNKKIINKTKVEFEIKSFGNIEKIIPVNNEYFIIYYSGCFYFHDIISLQLIKQLNMNNEIHFISKFKDEYIIAVDYNNMIKLIYIKTKEIVKIISIDEMSSISGFYISNKCFYVKTSDFIYEYKYHKSDKDWKKTVYKDCYRYNLFDLIFNNLIYN